MLLCYIYAQPHRDLNSVHNSNQPTVSIIGSCYYVIGPTAWWFSVRGTHSVLFSLTCMVMCSRTFLLQTLCTNGCACVSQMLCVHFPAFMLSPVLSIPHSLLSISRSSSRARQIQSACTMHPFVLIAVEVGSARCRSHSRSASRTLKSAPFVLRTHR